MSRREERGATRCRGWWIVLTAWLTLLSFRAAAEPTPAQREEARAKVTQARQQYNLGDFEKALKTYQEVYLLTDDPTLLFNIGQCQWKLGDDKAALHSYRSYLRSGKDPPNRDLVESRIAELEKRVSEAERKAPAPTSPDSAGALPSPAAASAPASPGDTVQPVPVGLALPPGSVEGSRPAGAELGVSAKPPQQESRPVYKRWWFWTGVGALVACGVAAALLIGSDRGSEPSCPAGVWCSP